MMRFETIEDYDDYLNDIKKDLDKIDHYLKEHPKSLGTRGNYMTLKHLYDIYANNRLEFIQKLGEINLKLEGKELNHPLPLKNMYLLGNKFNNTKNSTMNLLEGNSISDEDLLIEEISKGSYNIKFSFPNPTEEDVKRTSLRKKALLKIFDLIYCGDNIEKLKKQTGPTGKEVLINYKEFIGEIIKNKADFTIDTEKGNVKANLTLEQCQNIYENLNI